VPAFYRSESLSKVAAKVETGVPQRSQAWPPAIFCGALLAVGGARGAEPAPSAQEVMVQRVAPCTVCHGKEGRATADGFYPRIAGKPAGYLLNEMNNFRLGRRSFPQMVYFTQLRENIDLAEIAAYFASQRLPYPPPPPPKASPQALERGRTLVFSGNATLQVPACRSCHGSRLLGVEPVVPGLLGLSADYLQAQLGAWRYGTRAAQSPDCMATIARRLRPDDIAAAAAWLSSQVVPGDAAPSTSFETSPPLDCGSIVAARTSSQTSTEPQRGPSQALVKGQQLVTLGDCEGCHTDRGGAPFAGGRAIVTRFGTFYSPNITPDRSTGIGQWSSDDLWHALHDGLARDGRLLYPAFPYPNYTKITRADSDAIFEYLRSLAPVAKARRRHQLHFPYDQRALLEVWRALYFRPGVYEADPGRDAQWNRGAYLTQGLAHCNACHEPRNALGAPQAGGNPSGGLVLDWYAPSLSNPNEAGLQNWSADDIVTLLRSGRIAGSPAAHRSAATVGPMAEVVYESLQYIPEEDARAMAVYLRSMPPVESLRGAGLDPVRQAITDSAYDEGRTVYLRACADCHGEQGEGRPPIGPALAGNRAVTLGSVTNAARMVLFGGFPPGTMQNVRPLGMPPFYPFLSDEQIANALSYVRTSWGNAAGPVSASEVAENRGSPLW
jgi:cytochrome c553